MNIWNSGYLENDIELEVMSSKVELNGKMNVSKMAIDSKET